MNERKSKILIVDDERPNIHVLNAILQDECDISVALNGKQALKQAVGKKKPDLILLDIQMPDMDGFEVCRRLTANPETQDIPIIFITAISNEKDEAQGFAIGAVDYITKPFGPAVVLARIRAHLELKRKRDILKSLSTKDGLTAIANRRRFEEFFEFEWQRCVRSGEPIALIMADIDHFKLYNDHYGHAAGDECLREVAKTLAAMVVRQTDLAARYGGEEFACVLPNTNLAGALAVAEKMRQAVQELGIPHAFSPTATSLTLSLGVTAASPKNVSLARQGLFQAADQALYAAKAGGRNQVASGNNLAGQTGQAFSPPAVLGVQDVAGDEVQRILIVDDEQISVSVLKAIFENTYTVISASSGEQALRLARQEPRPDIILLDLQMPDMDGYAVCQALKADPRTRDIPTLFLTVLSKDTDEALGLKIGAVDSISKPFDPAVVLARVETHLKLRRALADLSRRNKILEEALNLRDNLERIARNDLKKPLSRILSTAIMLSAAPDMPPSRIGDILDIEQSGFELLEMIAASIDLWKLERGVYPLTPQPVDLVKILHIVRRAMEPLRMSVGVDLVVNAGGRAVSDKDHFPVQGEDLLCYSMLFNLVKNAVQASPQNFTVTIDLEQTDQARRVRISNTGVIPMEIRTRFMEKGTTFDKKDAKGLGAYTSRLMAEIMGAALHLEINDEKNVTTVSVDFSCQAL